MVLRRFMEVLKFKRQRGPTPAGDSPAASELSGWVGSGATWARARRMVASRVGVARDRRFGYCRLYRVVALDKIQEKQGVIECQAGSRSGKRGSNPSGRMTRNCGSR